MKVIVRSTEKYRADADELGQQEFILRQSELARQLSNLNFGTLIRSDERYIKLNCTKNLRCILTYRDFPVFGDIVRCYVALRLVTHKKYEDFCNSKDASFQASFSRVQEVDWDAIRTSLEDNSSEIESAFELKPLTEGESAFINHSSDLLLEFVTAPVYESDFWLSGVKDLSDDELVCVRDAINDWASGNQDREYAFGTLPAVGDGKIILLAIYQTSDSRNLFLLHLGKQEEIDAFVSKNLPNGNEAPFENLLRLCVRAYPCSLITSSDAACWIYKEKSSAANIMLSSREREFLSKSSVYPLCLSGRAGSGKSTLLRYLFADCLCRYFASGADLLPPLFISHSEHHAQKAKSICETLFENDFSNSRYFIDSGIDYESALRPLLSKSCRSFVAFARECAQKIADDDGVGDFFAPEKRMSFGAFSKEWKQKFKVTPGALENYGPELSWHIIRTFIKGWDADRELGIDGFLEIGEANHPYVSVADFKNVYENVWQWYSKLLDDRGMWDDQDLIRYCLDSTSEQCEMFGALYCDEIQEFTRIEREFLFRCSLFSRRQILNESEFFKMPFVFAGDEIQSVNLTGFCWDGLRSHLADIAKQMACDLFEPKPPEPIELTDNFRSAPAIVRLANRIHLLRLARTGGSVRYLPQHPHALSVNASESVFCLDPNDDSVWKKLADANAVVIVPCPDGVKMSTFIKSSPIADKIDFDGNGNAKGITLLSVRESKGIQHPCVALYGFDMQSDALGLDSLLDWFRHPHADPSQDIAIRRMLTAAYVSATRAQRKLFILGKCWKSNTIWSGLFKDGSAERNQKLEELDSRMFERAKWPYEPGILGYIKEGESDSIGCSGTSCTPEQARATETEALLERSKGGMRRASSMYAQLGMNTDETRCSAYASRLAHSHLMAARGFASLGMEKEALEDYWAEISNGHSPHLFSEIAKLSGLESIEYEFAKEAVSDRCSAKNVCSLLEKFLGVWADSPKAGFAHGTSKCLACGILRNI